MSKDKKTVPERAFGFKGKPLQFSYDPLFDVIEIEGEKYTGAVFRKFGGIIPPGTEFRINKKDGGALHITDLYTENREMVKELEVLAKQQEMSDNYTYAGRTQWLAEKMKARIKS